MALNFSWGPGDASVSLTVKECLHFPVMGNWLYLISSRCSAAAAENANSNYWQMLHPEKGAHEVLRAFRGGRKATLPGDEERFCGERVM